MRPTRSTLADRPNPKSFSRFPSAIAKGEDRSRMKIHFKTGSSNSISETVTNLDLARRFIGYLFTRSTAPKPTEPVDETAPSASAWDTLKREVATTSSLEQAVGRSIVVADLLARDAYHGGALADDASDTDRLRTTLAGALLARRTTSSVVLATFVLLITLVVALTTTFGGSSPTAQAVHPSRGTEGNAQLLQNAIPAALTDAPGSTTPVNLPVATTPPIPAPPSLASAPALRPHEVFGFAPYWTLSQSSGFDLSQLSTLAYFSIGVNADGTLSESGPGWNGYMSQAFASLVTRAHSVGDRVVLTVNDFDQGSLNQLTSSATAPATLSKAIVQAIQAKNLDGVNFDFEGAGNGDQTGLTNLVTQVSAAVHGVNSDYQVTMDTYASAAGDPNGFYNIRALAPAVDGFFVMTYQLNLQSPGSTDSPLTSSMFSEKTAIDQYVAAVPAAKVILGMPFFGTDWPTSDGTLTAQATGPATTVTYGQVMASGHPIYWDATTQTAWTSYQNGTQWHESFFEVPSSLYDATKLAAASGLGGMGIWALGMDGNDPALLSALRGFSPAVKNYSTGPLTTSTSSTSSTTSTSTSSTTSTSTSTTDSGSPSTTSTSTLTPTTTVEPSNPSRTRRPIPSTSTTSSDPSSAVSTTTPAPPP
jgi:hypothetical protein